VGARRLGAEVELRGAVGDDGFGRELEARLDELGIERGGVFRLPGPTGLAVPMVDDMGENSIVIAPGANLALTPDMLEGRPLRAGAVLVQGELRPDTTRRALEMVAGALRLLNAAPASRELLPSVALADVVVVNEVEAADMGGAGRLRELGAGRVVVTLGARGAAVEGAVVPAPVIRAVDTTGAGDAFCAALAVALVEGLRLEEAVAWANRAGAAACLKQGASAAMPDRDDLEHLW
jgi:ribokinase